MTAAHGGLVTLERAQRMLAEVSTAEDAANLIDLAEAGRVFAKQARLGTESINHATAIKLPGQLQVLKAWGFSYRTCAVWVKDRPGMGAWWRQQHELLLLGVKGQPGTPLPEHRLPSVIHAPRGEHSAKPEAVHDMAEVMFPHLTARLELFARRPRDGWHTWGNDEAVAS